MKERIERAHAGDREARNQIVEENMGLVWSIVRRFSGRGCEEEDLFQIGCIGLIKAIDRFDTSYEVKFSTYAVPMITGEIKRFLRDDGMIKVSRTVKENGWKIGKAAQRLGQELGRNATIDEIAAATELSRGEIVLAMEAGSEVDSIYRTIYESEGRDVSLVDQVIGVKNSAVGYAGSTETLQSVMTSENGGFIDEEKEEILDRMLLSELIRSLEPKEQELIRYRYFHDMTQTQVAKLLGISQVQVSRMEKRILQTMKRRGHLE
ncbi:MAG: sigma-70 family RNA polymerase sigma factor [Lachnospiraceae bacterium]|nr:sigma-70 family RNA polymerase sigma factor [Lachnospiraceae bacterium]